MVLLQQQGVMYVDQDKYVCLWMCEMKYVRSYEIRVMQYTYVYGSVLQGASTCTYLRRSVPRSEPVAPCTCTHTTPC